MKRVLVAIAVVGCKDAPAPPASGSAEPPTEPVDDGLLGSAPATLGAAFSGIAWDRAPRRSDARQLATRLGVELEFERGPTNLRAIEIKKSRDCAAFRERVVTAWGRPTNAAWHDPGSRIRASFGDADRACWLRFEPYLDLESWLAALPVDMVGGKPDVLASRLGEQAIRGDGKIKWELPGLGFAAVPTAVEATIADDTGKLSELVATVQTDPATTSALIALISKRVGSAPRVVIEDGTTKRYWDRSRPRFALFVTSNYLPGTDFFTLFVERSAPG